MNHTRICTLVLASLTALAVIGSLVGPSGSSVTFAKPPGPVTVAAARSEQDSETARETRRLQRPFWQPSYQSPDQDSETARENRRR